ncbi:MAG: MmcQ/YjbR family DNA-binding protein [Sphingobacteriales bacterium JAD_PAG50586_3]|nr:MAG: MmcQ/YjbR family DNA-binding protein [Sphingobacteriales bacterium JAD_PAG50586_3]
MSFPEAVEVPHFEIPSFRVKKKIFATLNPKENRCCIKLNPIDQNVFCSFDSTVIYPVPNKFGKQGWTLVNLGKVKKEMLIDALTTAYCTVAPPKLAEQVMEKYQD